MLFVCFFFCIFSKKCKKKSDPKSTKKQQKSKKKQPPNLDQNKCEKKRLNIQFTAGALGVPYKGEFAPLLSTDCCFNMGLAI